AEQQVAEAADLLDADLEAGVVERARVDLGEDQRLPEVLGADADGRPVGDRSAVVAAGPGIAVVVAARRGDEHERGDGGEQPPGPARTGGGGPALGRPGGGRGRPVVVARGGGRCHGVCPFPGWLLSWRPGGGR